MKNSTAEAVRALAERCRQRADRLEANVRESGAPESASARAVQGIVDNYRSVAIELDAIAPPEGCSAEALNRAYAQAET